MTSDDQNLNRWQNGPRPVYDGWCQMKPANILLLKDTKILTDRPENWMWAQGHGKDLRCSRAISDFKTLIFKKDLKGPGNTSMSPQSARK